MSKETCAACDYPLDDSRISVKIGGKNVEVCCEACAVKVREAYAAANAKQGGMRAHRGAAVQK